MESNFIFFWSKYDEFIYGSNIFCYLENLFKKQFLMIIFLVDFQNLINYTDFIQLKWRDKQIYIEKMDICDKDFLLHFIILCLKNN